VIRVLEQVVAWRGQPQAIRLDNGSEFLSDHFVSRCADRRIAPRYISAGQAGPECLHRTVQSDLSTRSARCLCIRVAGSGAGDQCTVDAGVQRGAAL
jgi:hypothetical protein